MPRALYVVKQAVDRDTVEALAGLLKEARAGKVIGLAYLALYRGDDYSGDLVGNVKEHPLMARGICRALEDEISSYLRRRR